MKVEPPGPRRIFGEAALVAVILTFISRLHKKYPMRNRDAPR
jgi:hypothetical protein